MIKDNNDLPYLKNASYLNSGIFLFVFASGSMLNTTAFAAAPTASASDLATQEYQRQIERQRQQEQQLQKPADARPDANQMVKPTSKALYPTDESPCFVINKISYAEDFNGFFNFALRSVTHGKNKALGRCLGVNGVNTVLAQIQNSLIARGYVTTRVFAVPQNLSTGNLLVKIIPGSVHAIRFADKQSERATKWNAIPTFTNQPLNLREIEQGLENFKRVPTADADIQIEPTTAKDALPGQSDLVVHYKQALPVRVALSVDDSGSDATGKYQGGATLSLDNPLRLNDLFYVTLNHDLGGGDAGEHGTNGYALHYSMPYGYGLFAINASENGYNQTVSGANQDYKYSGTSRNLEVKGSRMIYRDSTIKTSVWLKGFLKNSKNYIDDTLVEVQHRRTSGLELALNHNQNIGSTKLDATIAIRKGTGAFDAMDAPESLFNEGTSYYKLYTTDITVNQPFAINAPWAKQAFNYQAAIRGQWNDTGLVPQDRFAIGGRYTVRGFDGTQSLSAEKGWLLRNDLTAYLGQSGQAFYWGLDTGGVSGRSSEQLSGKWLVGTAIGLKGGINSGLAKGLQYDVFVGAPIQQPDGFRTDSTTYGFSLNWSH